MIQKAYNMIDGSLALLELMQALALDKTYPQCQPSLDSPRGSPLRLQEIQHEVQSQLLAKEVG